MQLQTAEVFGSHMVLQREKPLAIWGKAMPGSAISVEIQGHNAKARADQSGKWNLTLPSLHTSRNEKMVIEARTETASERLVYNDILVGEVWIAGGQSNMEFFMRYDKDYQEEGQHFDNPDVRFFDYPEVQTEDIRNRFDFSLFGKWRTCDAQNLQYYSAVAYYFARDLQNALQIPIGIVACNCGGTRSVCWVDEETAQTYGSVWVEDYRKGLAEIPDLEEARKNYMSGPMVDHSHPFDNPLNDRLLYGVSKEEMLKALSGMMESGGEIIGPWHEWRPCGLYHTMLEKIIPYTSRGVIWYQGESDEDHPEIYEKMMTGLIRLWRKKWNDPLPFLMVQLAPLGPLSDIVEDGIATYPVLRRQQELTSKHVSGVWLAATGDVGSSYDIHPKKKQPVGARLALLARGHVYGEKLLCDAPEVDTEHVSRKGDTIRIPFLHAEGGLKQVGDSINSLFVMEDHKCIPYMAEVEGEEICLKLHKDVGIVLIKFEEEPYYEANLFNCSGIPAKPFEISIDDSCRNLL